MTTRTAPLRMPARRRTALACTALTAVAGVTLTACGPSQVHGGGESYTVKDKVTVVDIEAHGGDVTVRAGAPERTTIGVSEDFQYDRTKPRTAHRVDDGTLKLTSDGCGGNGDTCSVDYTVTVPAATALRLKTGGGAITVRGTSGDVTAESGGGDVRMVASKARRAVATTGGGGISGTFAAAPSDVRYRSGGGSVTVRLPKAVYAVSADAAGGEASVGVATDAGASRRVSAHSGGGDVAVLRADQ